MFLLLAVVIVAAAITIRARSRRGHEIRRDAAGRGTAWALWSSGGACLAGGFVTGFGTGMVLFLPAALLLYLAARINVSKLLVAGGLASGIAAGALSGAVPMLAALWLSVAIAMPAGLLVSSRPIRWHRARHSS